MKHQVLFAGLAAALILSACGKKEEAAPVEAPAPAVEAAPMEAAPAEAAPMEEAAPAEAAPTEAAPAATEEPKDETAPQ
jgi:hypothetical protein